eukprot:1700889-Alexandrium_andersonii.AAC.1
MASCHVAGVGERRDKVRRLPKRWNEEHMCVAAFAAASTLVDPSVPPDARCRVTACIASAAEAVRSLEDVRGDRPDWFSDDTCRHLRAAAHVHRMLMSSRALLRKRFVSFVLAAWHAVCPSGVRSGGVRSVSWIRKKWREQRAKEAFVLSRHRAARVLSHKKIRADD